MGSDITSARVRELIERESAWTAPGGTYPPYINVTGKRLTVRGPATVGSIAEQFLVKPGQVVTIDLPDSSNLDNVALALCSEPARNRIADALDLLERVERQDAELVEQVARALWQARADDRMEQADWGRGGYKTAEVGMLFEARAALAALVGEK